MVYGDTKYRGEQMVRAHCPRHFVVRAGWMVGGGPGKDHKFVSKILGQVFAGKKTLHVVNDLWGTPTYTYDFAMNLCELLETQAYGTYHMVCEGTGTRFDVACELLRACGRADIEVIPVSSDYFKEEYFAPRPRSEMMANANLEKLGINRMRPWRDALHEYVRTHYAAKT
jgi:dTDP-4-dehydrorhamnose reductase